jgi:cytochrome c553
MLKPLVCKFDVAELMKNLCRGLLLVIVAISPIGAAPQKTASNADLSWAYPPSGTVAAPVNEKEKGGLKRLAGSSKTYTQEQLDDPLNPPDWFPDEHAPMPEVVKHGKGNPISGPACIQCHLASGLGHPESANLTGLTVEYLTRQLAEFKSGARTDYSRMSLIAKGLTDDEAREASEWFAKLNTKSWVKVVEAKTVPKTFVDRGRMRYPLPEGGTEALGKRIIIVPADPSRTEKRDPHSGFVAYVPIGSIKKGEVLAKTGGSGKTTACATCHGPGLKGLGDAPRIAGSTPIYIFRQLQGIQNGKRAGAMAELMKPVVAHLTEDDMIAIASYVASRTP